MNYFTEEDKNCHISFKSFLTNIVPVKCINILRHAKVLKISGIYLDTTCIYISTINTMLCNTDTNVFDHTTQKNDEGKMNHCTKFGINQIIIE